MYDDKIQPPELTIEDNESARFLNGKQALVTLKILNDFETIKTFDIKTYEAIGGSGEEVFVTLKIYWVYDKTKNKFKLCYEGRDRPIPLSSVTDNITWAKK